MLTSQLRNLTFYLFILFYFISFHFFGPKMNVNELSQNRNIIMSFLINIDIKCIS